MYILAAVLLLPGYSLAQRGDNTIRLEHADSLVGLVIDGEPARQLIGNVRFRQGKLIVECSRAIQYQQSNKIYFEGVVNVRDDSLRMVAQRAVYYEETRVVEALDRLLLEDGTTTLQARHGKYYSEEKRAHFQSNVVVADTGSLLTADEVIYDKREDHLRAIGNVRIENFAEGVVTHSGVFDNYRGRGYSVMTEEPWLLQCRKCPAGSDDTLYVAGRMIESYDHPARRLVVTDSVRIFKEELTGVAGTAVFTGDSISLFRGPYLWYSGAGSEENQVAGDSVFVALDGNRAEYVRVAGSASAVSRPESSLTERFNQLAGQEILMYFDGSVLREISVLRTATSLYYLFEQGRPNGMNKTSGDHVNLYFADGRMESIRVSESAEGRYYPEHLVAGREGEFNLPGFQWRRARPER